MDILILKFSSMDGGGGGGEFALLMLTEKDTLLAYGMDPDAQVMIRRLIEQDWTKGLTSFQYYEETNVGC